MEAAKKIESPFALGKNAMLIKSIQKSHIISRYKKELDLDVSHHFSNVEEVLIYKCVHTHYEFYYPYDIYGNAEFYEKLQEFNWYYMPWKWEHQKTLNLLSGNEKILEVGSGGLGFLKRLNQLGFDVTGLEINKKSIVDAKKLHLNLLEESIEDHSKLNKECYDICCSYQVLEHISSVDSFIQAQIECLKPGGRLIVSVPNNSVFLLSNGGGTLNMPPHHMGLWDNVSLKSLSKIYNLTYEKSYYEPLQEYHVKWFANTFYNQKIKKHPLLVKLFTKFKLNKLLETLIHLFKKKIKGHTIMVVYQKK